MLITHNLYLKFALKLIDVCYAPLNIITSLFSKIILTHVECTLVPKIFKNIARTSETNFSAQMECSAHI